MNRLNCLIRLAAVVPLAAIFVAAGHAAVTDIATTPMASTISNVKPNLMFVLDDSGSMAWDFLPDYIDDNSTCKLRSDGATACQVGDPPHYAAQFNGVYYNPLIQYKPGVDYLGNSLPTMGSPWTSVTNNAYVGGVNKNLVTAYPEMQYCNSTLAVCKKNGVSTPNPFFYNTAAPINGLPENPAVAAALTRASTTVTATTTTPHALAVGNIIYINSSVANFSGAYKVLSVTSTTIFTYGPVANSGSASASANGAGLGIFFTTNNGTAAFARPAGSSVVTVTTPTAHGLLVGDLVATNITFTGDVANQAVASVPNATTFTYVSGATTVGSDAAGLWTRSGLYTTAQTLNTHALYYTITPTEHCQDTSLSTCMLSAVPSGLFIFPAPVRFCQNASDQNSALVISGTAAGSPRCQAKFDTAHTLPRYGQFTRTDIVSTTATYANRPSRFDCAARPTCTYAEEMTNFANWHAYDRTRMQMMKSAAGQAFVALDDRYRVGFLTINPVVSGSSVSSTKFLAINDFASAQKQNWYTKFYAQSPANSTPLREGLSRVGRYYAGKSDGINSGMTPDPIQYSCQQNFTILTTDGYWNGPGGVELSSATAMRNYDNNLADSYTRRATATYDGGIAAATGTLADVAQYYYKNDLRPAGSTGVLGTDVSLETVPRSDKDTNQAQHMVTFTIGLVDGLMAFRSDYESAGTGDFFKITQGTVGGCPWIGAGTCNWPSPVADNLSALDDLWHAAVNGRGVYFQASNPNGLSTGLATALTGINVRLGAGSASAVSNPVPTLIDDFVFSSSFNTVQWFGELVAQRLDLNTGVALPTILWSAQTQLDAIVTTSSDTRTIYTFDDRAVPNPNKLRAFSTDTTTGLTAAEKTTYFANKCSPLSTMSQCNSLVAPNLALANSADNLINYLRGQTAMEGGAAVVAPDTSIYRDRLHALGDTVNSVPAYLGVPGFGYADAVVPDYASFVTANLLRQTAVFVGANDGMLHAFNAVNGSELWAYVPKMLFANLYALADTQYGSTHRYYVDGSPEISDVYDTVSHQWKTILVAGLNSGGRGYYALDVTNPSAPKALWELCSDSTLCARQDSDLGLSYGNPIITKRAYDGKWVVLLTSGYNNASPGNGRGYLYVLDPLTGVVLEKISTGVGDTATPSGLAKISAWADRGTVDNTAKWIYAGDLLGNVWRFDLTSSPTTALLLGRLTDAGGKLQPVTTRPELAQIGTNRVLYIGTGRYVGYSDVTDPTSHVPPDTTTAWQQSLYAFKDNSSNYGNIRTAAALIPQTIIVLNANQRTVSQNPVDWSTSNGWFVDFNPGGQSPGERVNLDPLLQLGTLVVTTNVPDGSACNIGGTSWQYDFGFLNGSYVNTAPSHIVGSRLGNFIAVGVNLIQLAGNAGVKSLDTGGGAERLTDPVSIGGVPAGGKRVGWREIVK